MAVFVGLMLFLTIVFCLFADAGIIGGLFFGAIVAFTIVASGVMVLTSEHSNAEIQKVASWILLTIAALLSEAAAQSRIEYVRGRKFLQYQQEQMAELDSVLARLSDRTKPHPESLKDVAPPPHALLQIPPKSRQLQFTAVICGIWALQLSYGSGLERGKQSS